MSNGLGQGQPLEHRQRDGSRTPEGDGEAQRKFLDCALAVIVLAVDPSLLYLLGEPEDPQAVWKKLEEQFQRKTWANKLQLRRKLYGLQLKEGGSVNDHIKTMSELFAALAVLGDGRRQMLASLPDSFYMLVTALEAQSESVPKWELVTERLLHEESKLREKVPTRMDSDGRKALTASSQRNPRRLQMSFLRQAWPLQEGLHEVLRVKRNKQPT